MAKNPDTTTIAVPKALHEELTGLKLVKEEKLSSVIERLAKEFVGNRK